MFHFIGCWIALLCLSTGLTAASQEQFAEELLLSPLPGGRLYAHFQFTQSTGFKRHYATFPKAISQMAAAVQFETLELSLTQGRWHHHKWGSPLRPDKPVGAELRASFNPSLPPSLVSHDWRALSHALGGLFCASLNFLARPETTAEQQLLLSPSGPAAAARRELFAALPQEAVCTENLTPWLKLLPCRDVAGLGVLFNREVLFLTEYHSLRVHVEVQRAPSGHPTSIHLTQTLSLVLRPSAAVGAPQAAAAAPKPGQYLPWDLASTFGRVLEGPCPAASHSRVYVHLPEQLVASLVGKLQGEQQERVGSEGAGTEVLGINPALLKLPAINRVPIAADAAPTAAAAAPGPAADATAIAGVTVAVAATGGAPAGVAAARHDSGTAQGEAKSAAAAAEGQDRNLLSWWKRASKWESGAQAVKPAPDAACLGYQWVDLQRQGSADLICVQKEAGRCKALQQVLLLYDLAAMREEAVSKQEQLRREGQENLSKENGKGNQGVEKRKKRQRKGVGKVEGMSISQEWGAEVAGKAVEVEQPLWVAKRRTLGSGTMHGSMVLHVYKTNSSRPGKGEAPLLPPPPPQQQQREGGGDQQGLKEGRQQRQQQQQQGQKQHLCVMQLVPWMVRVWLHTLKVAVDGKPTPLSSLLHSQHISLAQDRARPLLLHLCLALPPTAASISLEVQFSKAFLTVFEQPPDAYRGFDVPAAIISYLDPSEGVVTEQQQQGQREQQQQQGLGEQQEQQRQGPGQRQTGSTAQQQQQESSRVECSEAGSGAEAAIGGCCGGVEWEVELAQGHQRRAPLLAVTPLLKELAEPRIPQVYSEGLLVPLAVPDFSMPYNVICLTSTVLAVYFGATLNALLRRRPEDEDEAKRKKERRKKLIKLLVVAVVFGGLGVYLDSELQETLQKFLGIEEGSKDTN